MESDVTQSAGFYQFLAWLEINKKRLVTGATVAIVVGVVAWFFIWKHQQNQIDADHALSKVFVPQATGAAPRADAAAAYLKVASEYSGTPAAVRALLLAGGSMFAEGKYSEAQATFERLVRDHRESPFAAEAQLGIAASLESQGKTNEALTAYRTIVDRRPSENVLNPAKFSLARLYATQNQYEQAYRIFEDIGRNDPYGSLGSEAGMRAEELKLKHPELAKAPEPVGGTNVMPQTVVISNVVVGTNSAKP